MSNSIKALKLVMAALMSLKDKKGSSIQSIAKYLVTKYGVDQKVIKPLVYTGLIKGMKYGLIKNELGLYRLNPVLNSPVSDVCPSRPSTRSSTRSERSVRKKREVKARKQPAKGRGKKQKFNARKEVSRTSRITSCSRKPVIRKKIVKARPKGKPRRVIKRVKIKRAKVLNDEEKPNPEKPGMSTDTNTDNPSTK